MSSFQIPPEFLKEEEKMQMIYIAVALLGCTVLGEKEVYEIIVERNLIISYKQGLHTQQIIMQMLWSLGGLRRACRTPFLFFL